VFLPPGLSELRIDYRERRRANGLALSKTQVQAQSSEGPSEFHEGVSLIVRARSQFHHMPRNRAEQRSLELAVELDGVGNERIGGPRRCFGSSLDIVEVRVDACHPFSQVHLGTPYYTIRLFLSVST
jgi:hypothetical protein